jgi:hypothetical protein
MSEKQIRDWYRHSDEKISTTQAREYLGYALNTIDTLRAEVERLKEEACDYESSSITAQKAYNKQHDFYRDIFISLAKVEADNQRLQEVMAGGVEQLGGGVNSYEVIDAAHCFLEQALKETT